MATLNFLDSFEIPGILSFQRHGDLEKAVITTDSCVGEVYLQGAHITHWQPHGEDPILFLSEKSAFLPGKAIRGGIPIIFPWFGSRTPNKHSSRSDGPAHGFARTSLREAALARLAPGGRMVIKEAARDPRWKGALTVAQELVSTRVLRITEGDEVAFAPPDELAAPLRRGGLEVVIRRADRGYLHPHVLIVGRAADATVPS